MSKCTDCRKNELENTTWWERTKANLLLLLFKEEVIDLSQDKFTQGVSDGYKIGFKHGEDKARDAMKPILENLSQPSEPIFDPVDMEMVISINKGGLLTLGGEQASNDEVRRLKSEVLVLREFHLWQIMQETVKQKAIEKAILQSRDFNEVLAGKMMIHNLGILKSIVEIVSNVKV